MLPLSHVLMMLWLSPIQMHPLTTVAACGSTAQVVSNSTDEGLIWVTVKFGVLAPCFLREGASRQYWYLGILWHCALFLSLLFLAAGILADHCTLIKRFEWIILHWSRQDYSHHCE
ncbi:predicted protein [Lichtheimia corymbifera JMRC:FSU:9682]|uniref:Uncharacterized protein n=1 Tax=Lichtheimia corymbifera JMRC:FSU:9682 TaxID=1263082 RepID=A0A068SA57_9FUNG|nr:predicted protein [Lichtheimia corymbifera JMRC:FSU:9682]